MISGYKHSGYLGKCQQDQPLSSCGRAEKCCDWLYAKCSQLSLTISLPLFLSLPPSLSLPWGVTTKSELSSRLSSKNKRQPAILGQPGSLQTRKAPPSCPSILVSTPWLAQHNKQAPWCVLGEKRERPKLGIAATLSAE